MDQAPRLATEEPGQFRGDAATRPSKDAKTAETAHWGCKGCALLRGARPGDALRMRNGGLWPRPWVLVRCLLVRDSRISASAVRTARRVGPLEGV